MKLNFSVKPILSDGGVILFLFLLILLGLLKTAGAQINQVLEAENATLSGTAEIVNCNNASNGEMVKGLDNGSSNSLEFQGINIPQSAAYFVSVKYYAVNERILTYRINDEAAQIITVPKTGLWCYQGGAPGETVFEVQLEKGDNNVLFYLSLIHI